MDRGELQVTAGERTCRLGRGHVFTGMAANILDPKGRDINLFEGHPPFCKAINALPASAGPSAPWPGSSP